MDMLPYWHMRDGIELTLCNELLLLRECTVVPAAASLTERNRGDDPQWPSRHSAMPSADYVCHVMA